MSCLVIKNDGIGDLILASGIISQLGEYFRGDLDLVTCEQNREIAEMIPNVRRVFYVSRDDLHFSDRLWKWGILSGRGSKADRIVLRQIRGECYDTAISLRRFIRQNTLVIMRSVRAKKRYCAWQLPTNATSQLATRASKGWSHYRGPIDTLWEPAYYQSFLEREMGLEINPHPSLRFAHSTAASRYNKAVALGISGSSARWADENWLQTARLLAQGGWKIGLFGGRDSSALAIRICESVECVNEVGNLSFSDTASRLQEYPFYIGNDTGLSHLASLVVKKVLIIYGGGTFRRFFPWETAINQHVIYKGLDCFDCTWSCKHPERYCLTSIKSNDVVQFFDEIVAGTAPVERDLNSKNETYVTAWQILEGGKNVEVRSAREDMCTIPN